MDENHSGGYDDEIVALLHQVGARLLRSEQDRKELRKAMDDLVEKADQGERAYLTIQDRLNKTESIIEKRQKEIEKQQQEQMARIEKAAAMADRIEEALSQNVKISRRLDKMVQDKARTIRKLERIEEAVLETQDAVNARLLTAPAQHNADKSMAQNAQDSKEAAFKNWLPQAQAANDGLSGEARPWWRGQNAVRAGVIGGLVLLGLAGGWIISNVQSGDYSWSLGTVTTKMANTSDDGAPLSIYDNEDPAPSFSAMNDYDESSANYSPDKETFNRAIENALSDQAVQDAKQAVKALPIKEDAVTNETIESEQKTQQPDVLRQSDEQLLAQMEEDPDALAAQLNEISPATAASIIDEVHDATPKKETRATKVATSPKEKIKEFTTSEFLKAQTDKRPLRERIASDPNLPGVLKEVEKKAYEGISEAQHDLAAIYTAGHGGVNVDYGRAAAWFKESALNGVANARYNLGVLYHQGLGVKQDINTAVNWYRAAAEEGHPEAQYNLGIAYIEGIGTRYNPDKAAYYFEKAAKSGIMEAAYNLGLIYENGLAGTAKPDDALYWYKQAADQGSPEAKVAMDQLAKTLGLQPGEVERLYGSDKKVQAVTPEASNQVAAQTQSAPRTAPPPAPEPIPEGEVAERPPQRGMEYIEALPLDAAPNEAPPALAKIEENASAVSAQQNKATTDPAIVAQIQEQLIRLGLYPGPADGMYDTLTKDAIRAYQANYNLATDGRASQALLVHMMTSDMGANEYGSRAE